MPGKQEIASSSGNQWGLSETSKTVLKAAAVGTVGGVAVATAGPALLGFGSAGIAAGSQAAAMMSSAATANGGGVAAGGLVSTLQSIGVVGLSAAGMAAGTVVGAISCGTVAKIREKVFRPKPQSKL